MRKRVYNYSNMLIWSILWLRPPLIFIGRSQTVPKTETILSLNTKRNNNNNLVFRYTIICLKVIQLVKEKKKRITCQIFYYFYRWATYWTFILWCLRCFHDFFCYSFLPSLNLKFSLFQVFSLTFSTKPSSVTPNISASRHHDLAFFCCKGQKKMRRWNSCYS